MAQADDVMWMLYKADVRRRRKNVTPRPTIEDETPRYLKEVNNRVAILHLRLADDDDLV